MASANPRGIATAYAGSQRLRPTPAGVYVLFDPAALRNWEQTLAAVREAGVSWFQLRSKSATDRQLVVWGRRAVDILSGAHLIINDRPDIAAEVAAAGVHLGAGDLSPGAARDVLGADAVIGYTAGRGADSAALAASDYVGVGPYRLTTTKPERTSAVGADGLRSAVAAHAVPVVAIGGLLPDDAGTIRAMGASAIAVYGGIWLQSDPAVAAAHYVSAWDAR